MTQETAVKSLSILQVCHDTKGPFVNICRQYVKAMGHHQVTTVFLKGPRDEDAAKRIAGHGVIFFSEQSSQKKIDSMRGLKLNSLWYMAKLLKQASFDIAIVHRYKSLYVLGLVNLIYPIPKILVLAHEFNMLRRLSRRIVIKVLGKVKVAGVSNAVERGIAKSCPFLARGGRLSTLYNSLESSQLENLLSKDKAKQVLKLPAEGKLIGTVGRLVKKKNQAILLQALKEVTNTKLLLIGDGPEKASLLLLAKALGIEDRVIFAGAVDEAYRYLKALDLFVLPSGDEEAFGIVLLEAMLAKIPILSSDAPGPREVLADTGQYFSSGDEDDLAREIEKALIISDEEKAEQISRAYERQCLEFSEQAFQRRLFKLLELT